VKLRELIPIRSASLSTLNLTSDSRSSKPEFAERRDLPLAAEHVLFGMSARTNEKHTKSVRFRRQPGDVILSRVQAPKVIQP